MGDADDSLGAGGSWESCPLPRGSPFERGSSFATCELRTTPPGAASRRPPPPGGSTTRSSPPLDHERRRPCSPVSSGDSSRVTAMKRGRNGRSSPGSRSRRRRSRGARRRWSRESPEPAEVDRRGDYGWVEWGGELIWAVGHTSGGAPYGLRPSEFDAADLEAMGLDPGLVTARARADEPQPLAPGPRPAHQSGGVDDPF